MVDPCRVCSDCCTGLEPYCTGGRTLTYKAIGRDGQPTYGGYSQKIVVDEDFAVRMPATLPLQTAAPLLCAGITIVFAVAALTRRARHTRRHHRLRWVGGCRRADRAGHGYAGRRAGPRRRQARRCAAAGPDAFHVSTDPGTFIGLANSFDIVISTVPGNVVLDAHLGLLARDGVLVTRAIPEKPLSLSAKSLLDNRRSLAGTRSGGIAETQEMLDWFRLIRRCTTCACVWCSTVAWSS
jgi:alcohol dehydrogenase (NADP+)